MWIKRDFEAFLRALDPKQVHPIKVLKGPRQVGKTSVLDHMGTYKIVQFDDLITRNRAMENPRLFLDQIQSPMVLDEAHLAPNLFSELKRRVDDNRREQRKGKSPRHLDVWITGSNQTLLEKSVQESLAGRANYFDLNTLSIHELNGLNLSTHLLKGGWPELYVSPQLSPVQYLNDLISTFIERDIVAAAGIERRSAFLQTTGLLAGRIGQLLNASDIAKNVGVETTTVQSWIVKLQQNAIARIVQPYFTNLNQRLIKTPKIYFEDVGLACRLQGWTEFTPLYNSPAFGHLVENLALIEFCRFFANRGEAINVFFLRNKEKVEIDFLIKLPNDRWLIVEVKSNPDSFTKQQIDLIKRTKLNIVARWVVTPLADVAELSNCRVIPFEKIHDELKVLVI